MSLERLQAIADHLARVSPEDAEWLRGAVSDLRVGVSPAQALELQPAAARARRDAYLRRAAELLPGRDWPKAERLARWCRWMAGEGEQPGDDSELLDALRRARSAGLDLPESAKQIYRIITDTDADSCP